MKKYIALTIGPIIPTILRARHTRELWASSYMFSYLMKKIIGRLRQGEDFKMITPFSQGQESDPFFRTFKENQKAQSEEPDEKIKEHLEHHLYGAGLFPDQFILQTDIPDGFEKVKALVKMEVWAFAENATPILYRNLSKEEKTNTSESKFETKVKTWFSQFFRLYLIEKELEEGQNPILELSGNLTTCELQDIFPQTEENYLDDLLDQSPGSFLAKEAFGGKESFDSLVEVAARDFAGDTEYKKMEEKRLRRRNKSKSERDLEDAKDEGDLINYLAETYRKKTKKFPAFRAAHKYVAIVHADGDGIGALIKGLKTEKQFNTFSKSLKTFALEAVQHIKGFGGVPVYAGGDDLLFFAPVVRDESSENIFHLLQHLNESIKTHFKDFDVTPTLSFGVSISFYKFPLFEALEASRNLLFGEAKHYKPRNAIAFTVRKHSGHEFGALLPMQSNLESKLQKSTVFGQFMNMLKSGVTNPDRTLSSINYHIRSNTAMYRHIGSDAKKVENFIDNCFDEAIHDSSDTQQYLGDVKSLLPAVFKQHDGDPDKAADAIYALLRTADFLTENETTPENNGKN